MNAIEQALRDFLAARPAHVATALVGGTAVSARTKPRFTRDVDLAVAVVDDDEAMQYVFALRQRLSTIRFRCKGRGPILDLLFATCGIEPEVVRDAEPMENSRSGRRALV